MNLLEAAFFHLQMLKKSICGYLVLSGYLPAEYRIHWLPRKAKSGKMNMIE